MNIKILITTLLVLGFSTGIVHAAPTARVAQGELLGITDRGVSAFLGIPYAAPPTGNNRWRAPQPVPKWTGVRSAEQFAPSCRQDLSEGFGPYTSEYLVSGEVSEDCLYLNVWTAAQQGSNLPVMVWIHGGGFSAGSGSVPIYHGAHLAGQNVVVVTINYRLGVFGFLAHPELSREANGTPPGNFGLQDQVTALRWVKENIAAFGGDPNQITLAGQSAGAISISHLLTSPQAKGLFHRAIVQSGLPDWLPMQALAVAESSGQAFANAKGAESIEALRAMPAEVVATQSEGAPPFLFLPIMDGTLILESPKEALKAGRHIQVPVLAGFNADETEVNSETDFAAFQSKVQLYYRTFADQIIALYPADPPGEAERAMIRDRVLAGLYDWRRSSKGDAPVYAYLFDHPLPGPESERWGTFHSSEIPYVFRTFDASPERPFTDEDQTISKTMSNYWLNFVRTGNPNGPGLPRWPAFHSPSFELMELGDTYKPRPILPAEVRKVMNDYLEQGGATGPFPW